MEKEILHTNDAFNVVKKDGRYGVQPNKLSVVIMPYTSVRGLPATLGIMEEINPFREGGKSNTLITGSSNDEDPDILGTAQRKLKEETGYDVLDPDRWTFLGFLTLGKHSDNSSPCFACDVTGLEVSIAETADSDDKTPKSKFAMTPVKDALDTDDAFIPALFMKVFRYIFGFTGNQQPDDDQKTKTAAKQVIPDDVKEKAIALDGVNGVGYSENDGIVVYIKNSGLSDESKAALDAIFKEFGQDYKTEKIEEAQSH